ncbi:hypothetical protein ACLMJK_006546 [Lecanora helva]
MAFAILKFLIPFLLHLTTPSPLLTIPSSPLPSYDVLIIGGGPAGLSAASALGRVQRSALLIDSGVYRNAQTQHVHDVITRDGTVPSIFRALAREEIARYGTVRMMNGTVTSIASEGNGSYFTTSTAAGMQYLSKKVILATGVRDLIPDTPGLATAWGRGVYWCQWCDGYEHISRPVANLGPFSPSLIQGAIADTTLSPQQLLLTNGTYNNTTVAATAAILPNWAEQIKAYGIGIENRVIERIGRVKGDESDWEDDLEVVFVEGGSVVRNAIHARFGAEVASGELLRGVGVGMVRDEAGVEYVGVDEHMEASVPGVFVVGDANSLELGYVADLDGKGLLAKEYTNATLGIPHSKRDVFVDDNFEDAKRRLQRPMVEHNSAEDLFKYLKDW